IITLLLLSSLLPPPPPIPTLFPYTTLFRSHQHGIARIIELELINTHQRVFLEYFNGSRKAQGTNQIGIFHKRSERFLPWSVMPQRSQEMGFSDAEAAI